MTDEQFVRANWEACSIVWSSDEYRDGTQLHIPGGSFGVKNSVGNYELYLTPAIEAQIWAAAADFTRERLEQIRLLVLEIEHLCAADYSDQSGEVSDEADQAQERTRLRLADALGELKRGMRTAAPDGARSDAND